MKVFSFRLSVWLVISFLLLLSCNTSAPNTKQVESIQQPIPRPMMDHKTDSLKEYLDLERMRRKQQGKE